MNLLNAFDRTRHLARILICCLGLVNAAQAARTPASKPAQPPPAKLSHFQALILPDGHGQISWISDRAIATGAVEIERNGRFEEAGRSDMQEARNHRVMVGTLEPGSRVRLRVRSELVPGSPSTSQVQELTVPGGAVHRSQSIDLLLSPASPLQSERPLLAGVPVAQGTLWSTQELRAVDSAGPLASQTTAAAHWPDGSIRWLFVRVLAGTGSTGLHLKSSDEVAPADSPFKTSQGDEISIDNGLLRATWNRKRFALFDRVTQGGESLTGEPMLGNVRLIDGAGRAWGLGPVETAQWEEIGPVRAVLCVDGSLRAEDGAARFHYRLRYFFAARSPLVQVQLTITNNTDAPEFEHVRSLSVRIPLAGSEPLRGQLAGGNPVEIEKAGQHEIWQLSADRLRTLVNGESQETQGRSPGWAVVERGTGQIAFALRDFWQLWPKSIALKPDGLHVRLLPEMDPADCRTDKLTEWAKLYYGFDNGQYLLRRGVALRHEFWVRLGRTGDLERQGGPAEWAKAVLSPAYAAVSPDQYCTSGAFGPVQSAAVDRRPEYEAMVARSVEGLRSLQEQGREYGWLNFGDWHGERTYNWGNNEYDLSWAMALQFARTGRWDYLAVGEQMARHYGIVDTIHVPLKDRMAGRVWAHSVGHAGAALPDLANAPEAARLDQWIKADRYNLQFFRGLVDQGGHIYQEGNFINYFLTGDRDLLETGEMVCGAQATYMTASFDFTIERGAGWPLTNAVAAYESTGNPFYLNAARLYVERVLAKQDRAGGGWLLFQPPSECDGKPGVGGKAFATGILLYGLMRYDLVEPRNDVKHSIVEACRWLVEQMWNDKKAGFRYKTGCDKYRDDSNSSTTVAVCLPGLAYAYKMTHDPRFAHVLSRSYGAFCDGRVSMGKATGMACRQSAFALPMLPPASRPE